MEACIDDVKMAVAGDSVTACSGRPFQVELEAATTPDNADGSGQAGSAATHSGSFSWRDSLVQALCIVASVGVGAVGPLQGGANVRMGALVGSGVSSSFVM